jgi:hypothetical protein
MSYANPTPLRIGMHGNFGGRDYRLVGRTVMGESEGGETYYWNEFNLQAQDGSSADLVYEETERGGQWRLFTMFEPEYSLTAADAATKRVGDRLNLTGEDVRVTFCGRSRVYYIEGEAPEGVEVGDVANYFNAESGNTMQVVSWTGEDVEFYSGVTLARGVVNVAFNLPADGGLTRKFTPAGNGVGNYTGNLKFIFQAAMVVLVFFLVFGRSLSCSANREARPVQKISAGRPPLTVGAAGKVKEKNYHVTAHAVVEIDEDGCIFERHEYQLIDDDGHASRLVCGLQPGDKDWILFSALDPLVPPRVAECAGKKIGDNVNVDGVEGRVRTIFYSTVRSFDGQASGEWWDGLSRFGYVAQSNYDILTVRWNQAFPNFMTFERGSKVPAAAVQSAF